MDAKNPSLRPKRRYKIEKSAAELDTVKPSAASAAAQSARGPRLKRSGRPHQAWKGSAASLPTVPAKKSGAVPTKNEALRLLSRAGALVSEAYLRHSN